MEKKGGEAVAEGGGGEERAVGGRERVARCVRGEDGKEAGCGRGARHEIVEDLRGGQKVALAGEVERIRGGIGGGIGSIGDA